MAKTKTRAAHAPTKPSASEAPWVISIDKRAFDMATHYADRYLDYLERSERIAQEREDRRENLAGERGALEAQRRDEMFAGIVGKAVDMLVQALKPELEQKKPQPGPVGAPHENPDPKKQKPS